MTTLNIKKLRSKAKLTWTKPVLVISRSNQNIQAQIIDNTTKKTIAVVSSNTIKKGTKTEKATQVGDAIAVKVKKLKIESLVVNRNGLLYHGRVKALVEAVKKSGITI
jgi:large subunit ribosomal protein L18